MEKKPRGGQKGPQSSSGKKRVIVKSKRKPTEGAFTPCLDVAGVQFFKLGSYKVKTRQLDLKSLPKLTIYVTI
jgi:hypothetical protein